MLHQRRLGDRQSAFLVMALRLAGGIDNTSITGALADAMLTAMSRVSDHDAEVALAGLLKQQQAEQQDAALTQDVLAGAAALVPCLWADDEICLPHMPQRVCLLSLCNGRREESGLLLVSRSCSALSVGTSKGRDNASAARAAS